MMVEENISIGYLKALSKYSPGITDENNEKVLFTITHALSEM
jgi:hypothetical protein